ncbi:MAG: hypothetical protein IKW83_09075 [Muribaculaceae bacterium]|nr:hypothetical protein [Muribaculaceae bacterium]
MSFLLLTSSDKKHFEVNKKHFERNDKDIETDQELESLSFPDERSTTCADTLHRVFNDYNYVGDGARIVYAARVKDSQSGVNDIIVGITQKVGDFYKIYKLVKKEGKWTIDSENVKQISTAGYDVTFDQEKLMSSRDIIPQVTEIGGKKYFFYAYLQTPRGDQSKAQVVLNMYDVETRFIITANYQGEYQNVNGERVLVCNPASGNSAEVKWMNETARKFIRIIRFKGKEQPNEEDKKQKEEKKQEQKSKNSAVIETKEKDNPMFKMEDVIKSQRAGVFTVFLLKDGSVVSYNASTGKNSKIHSGGAKDIGFYDVTNCIISIRNSDDTRKRVNLKTGQIVNVEAASQPEKKEKKEKKKEEGGTTMP